MSEERPAIDTTKWIRSRLIQQTVREEGGKWHARFQADELGEFATQAEAMKAYRKAAAARFGEMNVPTDAEIDAAPPQTIQPRRPPPEAAPAQPVASPRPPQPPPQRR